MTNEQGLKILEEIFDHIRIVDPTNQRVLFEKGKPMASRETCYHIWCNGHVCNNCISMRALRTQKTITKIEAVKNRLYLIDAIPVNLGDQICVAEIMRDITESEIVRGVLALQDGDVGETANMKDVFETVNIMIMQDHLTKANNRKFIDDKLPVVLSKAEQENSNIAIVMVDIDYFKEVNDQYGHGAGDYVLTNFVSLIKQYIRKEDEWIARYGGEEFLVMFKDREDIASVCEAIRKKVEETTFETQGNKINITISMGICEMKDGYNQPRAIIQEADKKMYQAKKRGRNRIVI